jgi:hypothetical protein
MIARVAVASGVLLMLTWLVLALAAGPPEPTRATSSSVAPHRVLRATPETLDGMFSEADAGETIVLAAGHYGTFNGAMKLGEVVLRAEPGAEVTMKVDFNPAANITLEGLQITGLEIGDARSHDLTVRDSRFDRSQAIIRTGDLSEANILFERNVHAGYVKCRSCYEGRVQLPGQTRRDSGVTIRDSLFRGGNSDGIQNGGRGVRIIGNTFESIHQIDGAEGVHADAIQLYGSQGTVIRGNKMRDVATGIMAPDGTDHEVIEDNVIETDGYPYAITLGGDRGSILRSNRLPGGACHYGLRCGTLRISANKDGAGSRGTVVEENTLGAMAVDEASRLAVNRGNRVG